MPSSKTDLIRIRCSPQTKTEFKKIVADFKTAEDVILALISAYNQKSWVFKEIAAAKPSIK
jgi:hypothetical protein